MNDEIKAFPSGKYPVCVFRWCGPCKILGPKLESLVSAEEGKVILAKIDIDENTDLAMEHGVCF